MMAARRVIVIGAGMGGLAAAVRLAKYGYAVTVLEARAGSGGLACGVTFDGFEFDAGPYILLDRSGLEWALQALDVNPREHLNLQRIPDVYEVTSPSQPAVRIRASLDETADGLERDWPGSGDLYRTFIEKTRGLHRRLEPLRWVRRPRLLDLFRSGTWRDLPFLLRPLEKALIASGLPEPVRNAVGIWTHVAGQVTATAPSPLALVPAVVHGDGAYYATGGIAAVPQSLEAVARSAGVELRHGTRVRSIVSRNGRVRQVVLASGEQLEANAVVSNAGGLATYLSLLDGTPSGARERLAGLPRQSPGVCVNLKVKGLPRAPYLRFHLEGESQGCRLLVTPGVLADDISRDGWWPARLIAPMSYSGAQAGGDEGQAAFARQVVEETWWRTPFEGVEVLHVRTPSQWGSEHFLWENCMNPVMTSRLMRKGRLEHRSPYCRGLYLSGSSTHPGQWVSFCAISGIFAADCVKEDLG